jgi:hypothetical protein
LIAQCEQNFGEIDQANLVRTLEYLPGLSRVRRFDNPICWFFETDKDLHLASRRRAAIVCDSAFQAVPELLKAAEQAR